MSGPSTRPTGVLVVAALALVGGILGILASIAIFSLGGRLAEVSGLITLLISISELALAYGFWTVRPWAWRLAFALAVISPLWEIGRFLFRGADPLNLLLSIVFAAIWLYFLNLPGIRSVFHAPPSGFPLIGSSLDGILGGRK